MALASIKSVLWGLTVDEICDGAEELDVVLCRECRAKLEGWGVKIHNIFLSDLSNAIVIRHMGASAATVIPAPERESDQPESR